MHEGLLRPGILPPDKETEAFRMVQEALANALRHSGATAIDIEMTVIGERLSIVVSDDGRGFDPGVQRHAGLGLPGLHERAQVLEAEVAIRSSPGTGTRVEISIPLPPWAASPEPVAAHAADAARAV